MTKLPGTDPPPRTPLKEGQTWTVESVAKQKKHSLLLWGRNAVEIFDNSPRRLEIGLERPPAPGAAYMAAKKLLETSYVFLVKKNLINAALAS